MMEKRPEKRKVSGALAAAVAIALVILLIPAVAWTRESAHLYGIGLDGAFLAVYLPARLMALLGLTLMFFQFVLAARLPLVEKRFKRSSVVKTHRTVGKVAYLMVLLHGLGMLAFDLLSAGEIFLYRENTVGLVALVLLTFAVLAAWFFKPLKLSLKQWRTIHLFTYIVFPLVIWHALMLGSTVNAVPSLRILLFAFLGGYVLLLGYRIYRLRS
jgi:predicted ferric reductase